MVYSSKFEVSILKSKLTIILLVVSAIILWQVQAALPNIRPEEYSDVEYEYFKASIMHVENKEIDYGLEQMALVEITTGPHKNDQMLIDNFYRELDKYFDVKLEPGMDVLLYSYEQRGNTYIYLQDVVRDDGLFKGFIILAIAILLIGKIKGLKTIITLIITGFIIIQIMLPMILIGWQPIPVATISSLAIIFLTLLIIDGVSPKTIAAFLGTGIGIVIAGLLTYYIGEITHLTGLITEEAQMLAIETEALGVDQGFVDIRGLFYAGIIIGSLGAITDVGMSIASSACQFKSSKPEIGLRELYSRSLEVGKDIMATMTNTLILAYVGSSLPLLLLI